MSRIRTIKPQLIWSDAATASGATPYWLYCIAERGCDETGPCKVGIAADLTKRLSALQGGNWRPLELAWTVRVANRDNARHAEDYCLCKFRPDIYVPTGKPRLSSEWVEASPRAVLATALHILEITAGELKRVA